MLFSRLTETPTILADRIEVNWMRRFGLTESMVIGRLSVSSCRDSNLTTSRLQKQQQGALRRI